MNWPSNLLNLIISSVLYRGCISADLITRESSMRDGDLLISGGGNFALGFFGPGNPSHRYLGLWYNTIPEKTVVWVANRDNPIKDTSGRLGIDNLGNLILYDTKRSISVWGSNLSISSAASDCLAQLLDSGNLVLFQDSKKSSILWQSFDHPTDTLLPSMKLGLNRTSGLNRILTSWKSPDDPGMGTTYFMINPRGFPQLTLYKNHVLLSRASPSNGVRFIPAHSSWSNFSFRIDADEVVLVSNTSNSSILVREVVQESGIVQLFIWVENKSEWINFLTRPDDQCDFYGHCGANGNCNSDSTDQNECKCLPGFTPKSPNNWSMKDSSGGCVRKNPELVCRNGEGFAKVANAKVPDASVASFYMNITLRECESECLRNCSCTAYADADFTSGGSGCLMWYGDLMDTRVFSGRGRDLYVRVDAHVLAEFQKKGFLSRRKVLATLIMLVTAAAIISLAVSIVLVKKKRKGSAVGKELDGTIKDQVLPLFDISTIRAATDNFASTNKLGQGGFGPVYNVLYHVLTLKSFDLPICFSLSCPRWLRYTYEVNKWVSSRKPELKNKEVAVKRLSKSSGQGSQEFKNEVMLIAKLQHRNLVRLLGCCISRDERMLIYEYLPNKSLDCFIFNEANRTTLDWDQRFKIILGIARGVLYLHQDSRLKIIHRDLKASNVLLDSAMNPKISDFGMAKMFGEDQIQANTNRVVGTYGYMSPEYAMQGLYSIKSDVFSFGVLLLEIVSGKRNTDFYNDSASLNLIAHVWNLSKEGKSSDIVDPLMAQPYNSRQVSRRIRTGLLCAQEHAADQPPMLGIVLMLGNEAALASPNKPAFVLNRSGNILDFHRLRELLRTR
ncbi:G-type lectin S-receptor-like serine/threonine-protein kinase RKS1 isoform X3 [Rhodamnia argentea]|uniref:Receptor-like serine/threonine-protein kinase n=1 Tax=Rhodamnia argentea TaxID=178133 RepID=A0ABM3H612_9MYRT|nr:G-type lectin S-receptor-like serine/threonine-protein kinase RKS1 isoform X3 [Rhodamnia argentea]